MSDGGHSGLAEYMDWMIWNCLLPFHLTLDPFLTCALLTAWYSLLAKGRRDLRWMWESFVAKSRSEDVDDVESVEDGKEEALTVAADVVAVAKHTGEDVVDVAAAVAVVDVVVAGVVDAAVADADVVAATIAPAAAVAAIASGAVAAEQEPWLARWRWPAPSKEGSGA